MCLLWASVNHKAHYSQVSNSLKIQWREARASLFQLFLLSTGLTRGTSLFSPVAFQQRTCTGEMSHKGSRHGSFWAVCFDARRVRVLKTTKGGWEHASRAPPGAALQTSSLPLRSVIKLQEPDLQSPSWICRPHRTTPESKSSLMEMNPHVKEILCRKAQPDAAVLGCSPAPHKTNTLSARLLK